MEKKRIFTYWVSKEGEEMPAYIKLCMQSWERHIPDLETIILNHDNLEDWLNITFDKDYFKNVTLPMQSDIVSYYVLHRHGGICMDADTIITKDIFEEIYKFDKNKIYMFGDPLAKTCHVAFIACLQKNNKILFRGIKQVQSNLYQSATGRKQITWDIFSNSIYNELIRNNENAFHLIDRVASGAILEHELHLPNTALDYRHFYFDNTLNIKLENVISKIKFGAVLLHNSWTPDEYKAMSQEEILQDKTLLSQLLRYAIQ